MDPQPILYGSVLLGLVYLFLVFVLSRRRSSSFGGDATPAGSETEDGVDRDPDRITCPNCGAENERGYRYCARCVDELPGAAPRQPSSAAPGRRELL